MTQEHTQKIDGQDTNPQFTPQMVYVKDVSYEAPLGPRIPANTNPNINMNLSTAVNDLTAELKEVVLTINIRAVAEEKTLWLVEIQQAGAFMLRNIPAQDLQRLLAVYCPNYLLPYARQTVSDLLLKGGFPPFLIPPVNFESLLEQSINQAAAQPQPANLN